MDSVLKDIIYNTTIRFTESDMVEIVERNGVTNTVKCITFDDLCNAVIAARDDNAVKALASPMLPKNCIQYMERSNGELVVVLEREARSADFNYGGRTFRGVGVPKLIFMFRLLSNTIQESYVVAVKDSEITEETMLYHYPYSNVFQGGKICWGNRLPAYDQLKYLQNAPEMFLSMENNNHNYGSVNLSGLEYRPLLEKMEGQGFNEKWLKPMDAIYNIWLNSVLKIN